MGRWLANEVGRASRVGWRAGREADNLPELLEVAGRADPGCSGLTQVEHGQAVGGTATTHHLDGQEGEGGREREREGGRGERGGREEEGRGREEVGGEREGGRGEREGGRGRKREGEGRGREGGEREEERGGNEGGSEGKKGEKEYESLGEWERDKEREPSLLDHIFGSGASFFAR